EQQWLRLERPRSLRVLTNRPLVSLPGSKSVVQTDRGVRLTLWGGLPELQLLQRQPPIAETLIELHPHDVLDVDMTLHRGRVVLANTRKDRPARVRVRFENTSDPAQREMWDLTLDKGSEMLLDRWAFFLQGRFYDNPKDPMRTGPTSTMAVVVLRGTGTVRLGVETHGLQAPPGAGFLFWASQGGPKGPMRLKELPPPLQANAPVPKELNKLHDDLLKACRRLSIDLSSRGVAYTLKKALAQQDPTLQRVTVRCLAALDMVPALVDALGDKDKPAARMAAIEALQHWIAS